MFTLGSVVRDRITGFQGVAIARTEWLHQCRRYGVQSPALKDGVPTEAQWFDEAQLEAVEVAPAPEERDNGGPQRDPRSPVNADPRRQSA